MTDVTDVTNSPESESSAASADAQADAAVLHRARLRAGRISAVVALVVFGGKFAAYFLTDSAAVLSDAMESVVNIAAAAMLVLTLTIAARPADRDHPYGHGKVEFFSVGIEAAFIMLASLLIFFEAGLAIWTARPVHGFGIGVGVLAVFGGMNGLLGIYLLRVGKSTRSQALIADAHHVLADVWTSVAVIVGFGGAYLTGWVILDPLVALGVAVLILRTGWKLARDAVDGLMDAADEGVLSQIATVLERERSDEWIDVHGLRSWRSGAHLHTDLHMVVPRYLDAQRLHDIHEDIERILAEATGLGGDVVAHFDPCRRRYCPGCAMPECEVREFPFGERKALTVERARRTDEAAESSQSSVSEPVRSGTE